MENRFYKCQYCFKEFEPKRRRVQKYCSDTCRNKAHHARKVKSGTELTPKNNLLSTEKTPEYKPKKESLNAVNIGAAALGSLAADGIKSVFTREENKGVTKKEFQELRSLIAGARYLPVTNLQPNQFGQKPYYDIETQQLVYL